MEGVLVPVIGCVTLFIGLPWVIFHYITQWKRSSSLTIEDENLLDELHDLARRLDDRMSTIERIVAADDPTFRRPETERIRDEREDDHVFDHISERQRQRDRRR
jgi:phage shock protein B